MPCWRFRLQEFLIVVLLAAFGLWFWTRFTEVEDPRRDMGLINLTPLPVFVGILTVLAYRYSKR